jgi:acetyl-CoA acetyltransferase
VAAGHGRTAVVAGVAKLDENRLPGRTEPSLHAEVGNLALVDAGLTWADVDGFATAGNSNLYGFNLMEYLGIHPDWYDDTNVGGCSFEVLVEHAAHAVESGACEVVLVTYGSTQLSAAGRNLSVARGSRVDGQAVWGYLWGNTLVGSYAMIAARHMHEFGTTPEQLAEVAVSARAHAAHNPAAMYRKPLTIDDVLASKMIADPLHLFDCCVVSDGGAACVVTTAERATDLPKAPAHILGAAHAVTHSLTMSSMPDLTVSPAAQSGPLAFKRAGITPDDVDVLAVYDSFTITVLVTLEDLGFCPKGEGGRFVEGGRLRWDTPGGLPTNPDGGGLSATHPGMRGMYLIVESVRQLREEAGETQVPDARIAVAHGTGGHLSSGATLVLGRERP